MPRAADQAPPGSVSAVRQVPRHGALRPTPPLEPLYVVGAPRSAPTSRFRQFAVDAGMIAGPGVRSGQLPTFIMSPTLGHAAMAGNGAGNARVPGPVGRHPQGPAGGTPAWRRGR